MSPQERALPCTFQGQSPAAHFSLLATALRARAALTLPQSFLDEFQLAVAQLAAAMPLPFLSSLATATHTLFQMT